MEVENKNTVWKEIVTYIVVIVILLLIGFFIGRKTTEGKVIIETEYITLPQIHDTISAPYPVEVKKPVDTVRIIQDCLKKGIYTELFPYKKETDTVYTSRDTAQIIYDWASVRTYKETLFDTDTVGKCEIGVSIQYNRLDTVVYTYTPVQRQTTITKEKIRTISPFIGVGLSTSVAPRGEVGWHTSVDLEAGLFVKEKYGVGLEYQYEVLNGSHNVGAMFYYKF
jgi:hypothetical protein